MKCFKFVLLALTVISTALKAQQIKLINSGELINKAAALYDSSKYKNAIALLNEVNRSDTNYVWSVYEKALSCEADSQYAEAIKLCKEGLSLKEQRDYEPDLYNTYGNTLNDIGQPENALKIFDAAIAKYPAYSLLYFNKGVSYMVLKRYNDAEQWFQKTLLINPYMYSAHYQLGLVALMQGKIVPAMLSFTGYLLVTPSGRYWSKAIKLLDAISKSTDDVLDLKNKRSLNPDENYQQVEDIVLSKIALDQSYKPLISLDDPISRQIQAVFEKLEYKETDNDFWIQYYLPYFKKVYATGKFEAMIYHSFSNVNIPVIQEYNKKNKKELETFVNDAASYFDPIRESRELMYSKRAGVTNRYYFEDGKLAGKGVLGNGGKILTGPWELYYASGNIKARGNYNAAGQREGDWTFYYFPGIIKAKEHFKAGKLDGPQEFYFDNGNLSSKENDINDELDGLNIGYYYGGNIKSAAYYKLGKKNGEEKDYYSNGALESVGHYAAGVQTGTATDYYKSGQVKATALYANGKEDGPYKAYFENGIPSVEGQYVKDNAEGEFKYYYESGKIKEIRNYLNNTEDGLHQEYFENGQISSTYTLKKGKIDGEISTFYKDGKLLSKYNYNNGIVKSAKYFDKSGAPLSSSELKGNAIEVISFSTDGRKKSRATFNQKGDYIGADTLYYPSGKISQLDMYKDGESNGPSISWYLNGRKKSETNMVAGKEDGYSASYFSNGQLQVEGWVKDGQTQGEWRYYDEQGKLTVKSYFSNGDLDGYKEIYNPAGKKTVEEKYHNGWLEKVTQFDDAGNVLALDSFPKASGQYTLYYPGKQIMTQANYVNGDFDGPYKTFYFDGSIETEMSYKEGVLDGGYVSYYYGGKKETEGKFVNGVKTGEWKSYDEDGRLYSTMTYVNDQLNGTKTYYFAETGKPDYAAEYKDGVQEGAAKKYDPDGTLAYFVNYENGDAKSISYLGKDGKEVTPVAVPYTEEVLTAYFPNGKPSRTCRYSNGVKNGLEQLFYSNGQLRSTDTTEYGVSGGVAKEYYPNGKLKSIYNYKTDNPDGICQEFYANGTLKKEMVYENGVNNGPVKYYNENGRLYKTMLYNYGKLLSVKNE
ncbi:tetratricopeptide repeat protein [Mucilaginibacter sp. L3T2-6]|uniref:tetratricopeptide repeat protein n=1 Tax=Mucilaginibacter sp. L3T2-6 TaxID=3062491 RepID=UPI00267493DC|nr:tetratricopeptide repeat protein [Mucilaginibacter sp. L3T2-6]MDO3643240.1 tetratricopeptide repeat protein [Mucilaginibacter sp. L3T2-6]MDV6215564.1 tetratricopeptide repeat protein [Mucilaginibacter sp. L3T2-6]